MIREHFSNEPTAQNLRELPSSTPGDRSEIERPPVASAFPVHRIELERQNRTLRETQAELAHAVQRFVDLYDHLPMGYLTVTPEGRIIEANPAAVELLQQERPQLIGCHLRIFLDPYDAGRFAAHLEACAESKREGMIELTLRLAGGASVAARLSSRLASVVPEEPSRIYIALTDISTLKHAHRVLEDIKREQDAFNYSISHDLRAPLATIKNYAGIVTTDYEATLDPQAKAMVERIRGAAQRMEDTLLQLLDYSRLAREDLVLGPVCTEEVVQHVLAQHRALIEQCRADLVVDRPLPAVRATSGVLAQVLANLLTNALKYTAPGEPPRVSIRGESGGAKVVLKVEDRGIGIDPKYHERIFGVFERLHGYSRYPGSGVGLAIARRGVERMQGRIWCESEPGKGSCFCVELPAA